MVVIATPSGSLVLTLSTNSCCEDKTISNTLSPLLVLAHAEKESCLVLEVKSCGPHVLYAEEISTVYVLG